METQEELKTEIGNEEMVSLKPAKVRIDDVKIEELTSKATGKTSKKVVCISKHPEKLETISISTVKFENKGKLEVSGLWVNKDSKNLIRKGCALAIFMQHAGATTPEQLKGKDMDTAMDDKGYLCFKAY